MAYISKKEFDDKMDYTELKKLSVQHLLTRMKSKTVSSDIKDKIATMVVSKELTSSYKIESTVNGCTTVKTVDLAVLTSEEKEKLLETALAG